MPNNPVKHMIGSLIVVANPQLLEFGKGKTAIRDPRAKILPLPKRFGGKEARVAAEWFDKKIPNNWRWSWEND